MNNDSGQVVTFVDLLRDQIGILITVLLRPVVQQQVLAFFLILLISWLLFKGLYHWWQLNNDQARSDKISKIWPWLLALYHLLTPGSALVFLYITITLFAKQGHPNGLLKELTVLIWL